MERGSRSSHNNTSGGGPWFEDALLNIVTRSVVLAKCETEVSGSEQSPEGNPEAQSFDF